MKLKVCGLSRKKEIITSINHEVEFCGLILNYPKSHRHITFSRARELIKIIYNPLNLNHEEICKLEPNGILVEKDNNTEPIGIYIGSITNRNKRIYIILSFIPILTEKFDLFEDVRSAGLWICCDFKKIKAKDFIDACYKKGLILVQAAGENTIRIAPSLIISDKEIEEGFKRFEKAVRALK